MHDGEWRRVPSTDRQGVFDSLHTSTQPLALDSQGRMWAGSITDGLYRIDARTDGTFEVEQVALGPESASSPTGIVSLAGGSDGTMYAVTRDGRLAAVRPGDSVEWITLAQRCPSVASLHVDAYDSLWAFCYGSTLHVSSEGEARLFGPLEGLAQLRPFWNAARAGPDGSIYVGTTDGLVTFFPDRLPSAEPPPSATVEAVRLPEGSVRTSAGGMTLPPGSGTLSLDLAARRVALAPDWRFAWRLDYEGETGAWRELDGAALELAGLAHGSYALLLRTQRGARNGPVETVALAVAPFVWETGWFRGASALLLLGLLYSAHRYRLSQIRRRLLLRQRIADDLHDDLGAKAGAIALRLDMERRLVSTAGGDGVDPQSERLHALAGEARQLVRDVRDVVWVVDSSEDQLSALAERIAEAARALIPANRLTLEIAGLPDASVPMGARRHLLLAAKEALHNASKYAGEAHVDVRLSCDGGMLVIAVADYGTGFDMAAVSGGGRGMRTLQRRAAEAGATLELESAPGRGTSVTLRWRIGGSA